MAVIRLSAPLSLLPRLLPLLVTIVFRPITNPSSVRLSQDSFPLLLPVSCSTGVSLLRKESDFYSHFATTPSVGPTRLLVWPWPHRVASSGRLYSPRPFSSFDLPAFSVHSSPSKVSDAASLFEGAFGGICDSEFSRETPDNESPVDPEARNILAAASPTHSWSIDWPTKWSHVSRADRGHAMQARNVFGKVNCCPCRDERRFLERRTTNRTRVNSRSGGRSGCSSSSPRTEKGKFEERRRSSQEEKQGNGDKDGRRRNICFAEMGRTLKRRAAGGRDRCREGERKKKRRGDIAASQARSLSFCGFFRLGGSSTLPASQPSAQGSRSIPSALPFSLESPFSRSTPLRVPSALYTPLSFFRASWLSQTKPTCFLSSLDPVGPPSGQKVGPSSTGAARGFSSPLSGCTTLQVSSFVAPTPAMSQVSTCPPSPCLPPSSSSEFSSSSLESSLSSRQSLSSPPSASSPSSRIMFPPRPPPSLASSSLSNRRSTPKSSFRPFTHLRKPTRRRGRSPAVGVGSLSMKGWGRNSDYSWEEDDETVKVLVVVEPEASGKDVDCVISPRKLFLKLRHRKLPLIDGTLKGRVAVGDSYWCIEDLTDKKRQHGSPASHPTHSSSLPPTCQRPSPRKRVPTDAEMEEKPWLAMDLVDSSQDDRSGNFGGIAPEDVADPPASSADEMDETAKVISVYLKKKPLSPSAAAGLVSSLPPDWGGVLEGEEIEDLFYDHAPSKIRDIEPRHRSQAWLPGVLLYRQPFPPSFSREDALHFIDSWTRGRTAVDGAAAAAVPSLLARAAAEGTPPGLTQKDLPAGGRGNSQASSGLRPRDAALLASETVDSTLDFGIPQTQMMIMVSPLPDGARLSFEGPQSLWEGRQLRRQLGQGEEAKGDLSRSRRGRAPVSSGSANSADMRTAATAAGLDPRSALFGQALALATENQFEKEGPACQGGYDAYGGWAAEDGVELRVLGGEEEQAGGRKSGGLELVVLRGPGATGGAGQFGPVLSLKVKDTEDRVLRKLQHDLLGVTLAMKEIHLAKEKQREHSDDEFSPDSYSPYSLQTKQKPGDTSEQSAASPSSSYSPLSAESMQTDTTSGQSTGFPETPRCKGLSDSRPTANHVHEHATDSDNREGPSLEAKKRRGDTPQDKSVLGEQTALAFLAGSREEDMQSSITGQPEYGGQNETSSVHSGASGQDDANLSDLKKDRAVRSQGAWIDGEKSSFGDEVKEGRKTIESSLTSEETPKAQEEGRSLGMNQRGPAIEDTSEIDAEWIQKYPGLQKTIEEERDWLAKFPLKTVKGEEIRTPDDLISLQGGKQKKERSTRNEAERVKEEEAKERKENEKALYGIKVMDFNGDKASSMPDFMKNWTPERRKEFQRDIVYDLKENIRKAQQGKEVLSMADVTRYLQTHLDFTDAEMRQVWQEGHAEAARFLEDPDRSIEGLKEKQNNRKKQWAQHELFFPLRSETTGSHGGTEEGQLEEKLKVFDVMAGPGFEIQSPHTLGFKVLQTEYDRPLHERWEDLSEKEQFSIRMKLHEQEGRFEMLVAELLAVKDESLYPVICDQYKDLLMHEHFLLLMKLRIQEKPPQEQKEKDVLVLINKFVVSLYEDLEALALQNEKEQMKKIRLLCMQALVDIDKLTDYAQSMKHLLNRDFFAYLEFAVHAERKRIQKEGNNPDAAPSQWLMVLLIIQKGVTAIYEKEIWEDALWITMVVTQKPPEVRRKLLELFVAQLPKADWKQFKKVALRMADALAKSDVAEAAFPACPWVPEAVAQLARDLQRILPDWMIEGMMTDFDKQVLKQKMDRMSFLWGEKDLQNLRNVNVTLPNVSEMMKQEIQEATEIFNMRQGVNERTGEVINLPPPGSPSGS